MKKSLKYEISYSMLAEFEYKVFQKKQKKKSEIKP